MVNEVLRVETVSAPRQKDAHNCGVFCLEVRIFKHPLLHILLLFVSWFTVLEAIFPLIYQFTSTCIGAHAFVGIFCE